MDSTEKASIIAHLWSVLSKDENGYIKSWSIIALDENSSDYFRVGIKFPEKQEALLVGFKYLPSESQKKLPQGKGFIVEQIQDESLSQDMTWIALYRESSANLEMFSAMASDVYNFCIRKKNLSEKALYAAFLQRIKAWQQFMKRNSVGLTREEILGLCGELEVLSKLIERFQNQPSVNVMDFWVGPSFGLHDFKLDHGDIEIKSTIKSSEQFVNIHSDQLEIANSNKLFLVCCVFSRSDKGDSLVDRVNNIRAQLACRKDILFQFENSLVGLGVTDKVLEDDVKYEFNEFIIHEITPDFPCLRASFLPTVISNVSYKLNVSKIEQHYTNIEEVFFSIMDNK